MNYGALDIFEQLRPEDTQWLLASSQIKTIAANRVLVREDDPSETIFFVADGLFEVYVFAGSGTNLKVGQLGPGDVIGEMSWLDRRPVSASVRAIETSSVIALPTQVLEARLAANPGFAARFFRGIATLTVERLRKTTSALRRAQWAAGTGPAHAESAERSAISQRIDWFKSLLAAAQQRVAAGGGTVVADDARQIRDWMSAFENEISPGGKPLAGVAEVLQAELMPFMQLSATVQRCQARPRGYAGDYQTIAMIYDNAGAGTGPIGALLDSCVLNLAAMKAMRNRRANLAGEIEALFRGSAKEFHVTSLASGPAREVFDVLEKVDDKGRLSVNCVDVDREALAQIAARAQQQGLAAQVRTVQANLIHMATGRQELDLGLQDVIYSVGFVESLSDELALTLIDWMHDKLRPGGRVILGTLHPSNPTRGLMDHVLDWQMTHRDDAEMSRLFQNSKFARPCTRVLSEPEGIALLAECIK